jgi:4-oxalocrotonate tautomerase
VPIVEFHLVEGLYSAAAQQRLLAEASALYADVLDSPVERIRALITLHVPTLAAVGGETVSRGGDAATYFTFLMLEGRPTEQRRRLLGGFTDLLVDVLGVSRALVRGRCVRLDPEDWAIGGTPASAARADEIQARTAP